MTVNEEIDALTTLGLSPMEFLVVPRMLALVTMMPLLTLYADLLGILGGGLIGVAVLQISPVEYFNQTRAALTLSAVATDATNVARRSGLTTRLRSVSVSSTDAVMYSSAA